MTKKTGGYQRQNWHMALLEKADRDKNNTLALSFAYHWISLSKVILTKLRLYKYGAQRSNNIVSVHHLDLVSTRGGQFFGLYLLDGLTVGLGLVLGATTRAFFWSCQ